MTITAVTNKGNATCSIQVKPAPELSLKLNPSEISYDGTAILTAKVVNAVDGADIEINDPEVGSGLIIDDRDANDAGTERSWSVTTDPEKGISGTFDISVTATLDGSDLATEQVTLNVGMPEIKVTALKAGTAKVTVKAYRENQEGPSGENALPSYSEAYITITVKDSRAFEVEGETELIELDVNPKAQKLSASFTVINDYGMDTTKTEVTGSTAVSAKLDRTTGVVTVSIPDTLKETGTAVVRISREGDPKTFEIPVIILNSSNPPVIETEVKIEISDEAFDAEPEISGADLSALTEEQKDKVNEQIAEQKEALSEKVAEAMNAAADDEEVKAQLNTYLHGLEDAANEFGDINPGEIVKVYPKQLLENVAMESVVTVDEKTGEVTVETVIKKLEFEISIYMDRLDENGDTVTEGTKLNLNDNKKVISIPLVLPSEGIPSIAKYAKTYHNGKLLDYFAIQEVNGVKMTVIKTKNFSPFAIEFAESKPSESHNESMRSSSGHGSSSSSGQWVMGMQGWQYIKSGARLTNCWQNLLWNGVVQWYHFDANSYMTAGWFTDVDGNKYFLHNVADGHQGYMYAGWNMIDGKWYYFKEYTGGPYGSLLISGVTPDGHVTDMNGMCADYQPAN